MEGKLWNERRARTKDRKKNEKKEENKVKSEKWIKLWGKCMDGEKVKEKEKKWRY